MFIRNLDYCPEFTAGDNSLLREIFNPVKDDLTLGQGQAGTDDCKAQVKKLGGILYSRG